MQTPTTSNDRQKQPSNKTKTMGFDLFLEKKLKNFFTQKSPSPYPVDVSAVHRPLSTVGLFLDLKNSKTIQFKCPNPPLLPLFPHKLALQGTKKAQL
jgi:hypothetical protein